MTKSCINCIHKDTCLRRGMLLFQWYIVTGRYDEAEKAKKTLNIGVDCNDFSPIEHQPEDAV